MLTVDALRELLHYDPLTGLFTWRVKPCKRMGAGTAAGSKTKRGYVSIRVHGKPQYAHRVAWLYMFGIWPTNQIDHINGKGTDNRLVNLREGTPSENAQNLRGAHKNNTSGFLGASYESQTGKWRAQIQLNGSSVKLGRYDSPELAHAAYLNAKAKLHPFSTLETPT